MPPGYYGCSNYCERRDFPLLIVAKSFRYHTIGYKKCTTCIYITHTELVYCPCCGRPFSKRPKCGHRAKTRIPIELRPNVKVLG